MRIFIVFYPILVALAFVSSTSIEISSASITVPDPESLINSISCAIFDVYQSAIVALHKHISEVLEATTDHVETVGNEVSRGTRFMFDAVRPEVNLVFGNFKTALKKLSDTVKEASNLGQIELEPAQVVWNELKHGIRRLKRYIPLIRAYMNKSLVEIEKNFENGTEQFNEAMNDLYTKVSNKLCYEVRSATKMLQHALSLPSIKYYDIDLEDVYRNWTQLLQPAKEIPINFFNAAKNLINLIYNNIQTKFFLSGILSENSLWPSSSVVWGDAVQVKRFVDNSLKRLENYIKTSVAQIRTKFGKDSAALSEANQSLYNQIYNEVKHLIDLTESPFKRIFNLIGEQPPFSTVHVTDPSYDGRFEELLKYLQAKGYPVQIGLVECINLVSHSDDTHSQAETFFDYLLEDTFKNSSPSEVMSLYNNILQEERIREVTNIYRRLFDVVQKCAGTALEDGYKLPKLISMKIEDDAYTYTLLVNDIWASLSKSACFIEEYYSPTSEEYQNAINNLCEDIRHKLDIAADYTLDSIKRLNNYLENHERCLEKFTLWTDSGSADSVTSAFDNDEENESKMVHGLTSISGTNNIENVGSKDVKTSNLEGKGESSNSDTVAITTGALDTESTSTVDIIKTESQLYNSEETHTAITELNHGLRVNEKQEFCDVAEDVLKSEDLMMMTKKTAIINQEDQILSNGETFETAHGDVDELVPIETVKTIKEGSTTSKNQYMFAATSILTDNASPEESQPHNIEELISPRSRLTSDIELGMSSEEASDEESAYTKESATVQHVVHNLSTSSKTNEEQSITQKSVLDTSMQNLDDVDIITLEENKTNQMEELSHHPLTTDQNQHEKYSSGIDESEQRGKTGEVIIQKMDECDSDTKNLISHHEMSEVESKTHEDATFLSTTKTDASVLNEAAGGHDQMLVHNDDIVSSTSVNDERSIAMKIDESSRHMASTVVGSDLVINDDALDTNSHDSASGEEVQDSMTHNAISAKSVVNEASGSFTQLASGVQADNCDNSSHSTSSAVPLLDEEIEKQLVKKETEPAVQAKLNARITEHHSKECIHKRVAGEKSPTHDFDRKIKVEHGSAVSHTQSEIMREKNELNIVSEGSESSTNMEHKTVVDDLGYEKIMTSSSNNHDFSEITKVGHLHEKSDLMSLNIDDLSLRQDLDDLRKNSEEGTEMNDSVFRDIVKSSEKSSNIKKILKHEQSDAENIEVRTSQSNYEDEITENIVTSSSNNDLSSFTNSYSSNNMKDSSEEGAIGGEEVSCSSGISGDTVNEKIMPLCKSLDRLESGETNNKEISEKKYSTADHSHTEDHITVHSGNNISDAQSLDVSENVEEKDTLHKDLTVHSSSNLSVAQSSSVCKNIEENDHKYVSRSIDQNERDLSTNEELNFETKSDVLVNTVVENHVEENTEISHDSETEYAESTVAAYKNTRTSSSGEDCENSEKVIERNGSIVEETISHSVVSHSSSDSTVEQHSKICEDIEDSSNVNLLFDDSEKDHVFAQCSNSKVSTENRKEEKVQVGTSGTVIDDTVIETIPHSCSNDDLNVSKNSDLSRKNKECHQENTGVCCHAVENIADKTIVPTNGDDKSHNVECAGGSHSTINVVNDEFGVEANDGISVMSCRSLHTDSEVYHEDSSIVNADRQVNVNEVKENIVEHELNNLRQNNVSLLEESQSESTLEISSRLEKEVEETSTRSAVLQTEEEIFGEKIVADKNIINSEVSTMNDSEKLGNEIGPDEQQESKLNLKCDTINNSILDNADNSGIVSAKDHIETKILKEGEYTIERSWKEEKGICTEMAGRTHGTETADNKMISNIEDETMTAFETTESSTMTRQESEVSTLEQSTSEGRLQSLKVDDDLSEQTTSGLELKNISHENDVEQTLLDESFTTHDISSTARKAMVKNEINTEKTDVSAEELFRMSQLKTDNATTSAKVDDDASSDGPLYHMIWLPKKPWKSESPPPPTSESDDDHGWLGWLLPGKRPILDTNPESLPDTLGRVYDRIRGTRTSTFDKQSDTPITENMGMAEQSSDYSSSKSEITQSSFTKSSSHSSSTDIQVSETDATCDENERNLGLTMANPISLEHEEPIFYKKWYNSLVKTK